MRAKSKCIEWKADGSCAKFGFTEEDGFIADLKKCSNEERDKIVHEIGRGFKVREPEPETTKKTEKIKKK